MVFTYEVMANAGLAPAQGARAWFLGDADLWISSLFLLFFLSPSLSLLSYIHPKTGQREKRSTEASNDALGITSFQVCQAYPSHQEHPILAALILC